MTEVTSEVEAFIEERWMLTNRAKKWLRHHPDGLKLFLFDNRDVHYRHLTWYEDRELERFNKPRIVNKNLTIRDAFISEEAHRQLGEAMASMLYETANRPGFMRTLAFHQTNHTVEEFTRSEVRRAHRILRRVKNISMREIVRALRRIK